MLLFIQGVVAGSFSMLVIMSLMYASKKGDEQSERLYNNS